MDAEARTLHKRLKAEVVLPKGWVCERSWPWREGTHLIAPRTKGGGGVIIKERQIRVQLPGDGPAPPSFRITDGREWDFKGRGWQDRIIEAARRAIRTHKLLRARDNSRMAADVQYDWNEL